MALRSLTPTAWPPTVISRVGSTSVSMFVHVWSLIQFHGELLEHEGASGGRGV